MADFVLSEKTPIKILSQLFTIIIYFTDFSNILHAYIVGVVRAWFNISNRQALFTSFSLVTANHKR